MQALTKEQMKLVAGGQAAAVVAVVASAPQAATGMSRLEVGAIAAGIGGGVGASYAIEAAGGLAAMGAAAVGVGAAAGTGILSAGYAGYAVGGWLYDHSETLQNVSQAAVGVVIEYFQSDVHKDFEGIGEHSCTYGSGGRPIGDEENNYSVL